MFILPNLFPYFYNYNDEPKQPEYCEFKSSFTKETQPNVFSITQWNTLADCLADSFPKCSDEHLKWSYRNILHKEHLKQRANADIICLEEVDHPEFFESILSDTHHTFFNKKPEGKDGIFVAVRKSKFNVSENEAI